MTITGPTPVARALRTLVMMFVVWHFAALVLAGSIFADLNIRFIGSASYHVLHLLGHAAIVLVAFGHRETRKRILESPGVLLTVMLYGVAVVVSTVAAPIDAMRLVLCLLVPLTILSFVVCLPLIVTPGQYRSLLVILTVMLSTSSVLSLGLALNDSSHFLGRELSTIWRSLRGGPWIATGLYSNPNTAGAFLAFFPAIIVYLIRTGGHRVFYALGFGAIALNLLLTFSRSAQVVAIISLLPLAWHLARRRIWAATAVAGALLVATLAVLASVAEFRNYLALGVTLGDRGTYWRALVPRVWEKPVLGFGLLNVSYEGYTPHNIFLAQLLFYGVVGWLAFMAMLVALGRRVAATVGELRERLDVRVLTSLLVGALVQGLVEYIITFPLFFANSLFWLVLGMVVQKNL